MPLDDGFRPITANIHGKTVVNDLDKMLEELSAAILRGATLVANAETAKPFIEAAAEMHAGDLIKIRVVEAVPLGIVLTLDPGVSLTEVMDNLMPYPADDNLN
jgi:hypothetical protein